MRRALCLMLMVAGAAHAQDAARIAHAPAENLQVGNAPSGHAPSENAQPGNTPSGRVQPGHVLAPAFVPGGPAVDADRDAVKTMVDALRSPLQGNADQDFASRMVPMDQAAIELAEAALKYGGDAKMKQMAARIIASRQHEIAFLQAWQTKHPARSPAIDPPIQFK